MSPAHDTLWLETSPAHDSVWPQAAPAAALTQPPQPQRLRWQPLSLLVGGVNHNALAKAGSLNAWVIAGPTTGRCSSACCW